MNYILVFFISVSLSIVLFFYRRFQHRPADPAGHFPVTQQELITVIQSPDGPVTLNWEEDLKPKQITLLRSLEDLTPIQEWNDFDPSNKIALKTDGKSRAFFRVVTKTEENLLVADRFIPFRHIRNFRDLGGYETEDGKQVAWGKVFRSGTLGKPVSTDLERFKKLSLTMVIDMRDDREISYHPDLIPESIQYRHVFIADRVMVNPSSVVFRRRLLGKEFVESYKTMIIDAGAPGIAEVFRLLADPTNLPTVFHCTAGKDRTGVVAALILLAIGVPEETVTADYSLSNLFAPQIIREYEKNIQKAWWLGMRVEHFYPLFSAHPDIMRNTLDYIKTQYGSVTGYLINKACVTESHIAQLRENLLN